MSPHISQCHQCLSEGQAALQGDGAPVEMAQGRLAPSTISYSAAINTMGRAERPHKSMEHLAEMRRNAWGQVPSHIAQSSEHVPKSSSLTGDDALC